MRRAVESGVCVPATIVPSGEEDLRDGSARLGLPLVVKGEKGSGSENVRIVHDYERLVSAYREILDRESPYGGRPALQQYIAGPSYVVGGLFYQGKPLRICAHRKLVMLPPTGGITIKAVTERPPDLLDQAFKAAEALQMTGLMAMDFIRDSRDGSFRFLEVNPRLWASIGVAEQAGVDLFTPYHHLAKGEKVAPRLGYGEGVTYRLVRLYEVLIAKHPKSLREFMIDSLDSRVRSDFEWFDPFPFIPSLGALRRMLRRLWSRS
ncbi:MAG: ATP-grasp domain-containing protein [Candidatus Binataceae bacterium]